MKVVEVTWHDAHQKTDEKQNGLSIDKFHQPLVVRSLGYIVRKDKKGLTLAGCYENFIEDEVEYDRTIYIPNGMIISITTLRKR